MAKNMMTAREVASAILADEHADVLREAVSSIVHEIMEAEVEQLAGAARHERSEDRSAYRNGYRPRPWQTRVGEVELMIPRVRSGPAYMPSFIEPRSRVEQALVGVVTEAYINGVSTRKVDRICKQFGLTDLSKDRVSRLNKALDEQVTAFLERPLEGHYPYLWFDAKIEKVRASDNQVRHKALVIAYGVHESGRREVIGIDVGEAETEAFWMEFIRALRARGLSGAKLAVSDDHLGLKAAIAKVIGCRWQRCSVHFLRNMLGHCKKDHRPLISAALRQVFNAASGEDARRIVGEVAEKLEAIEPKVSALLLAAEEDLLAFYEFPKEHWRQLRSTNPLERINREVDARMSSASSPTTPP
jgi:transposase-like protein